MVFWEDFAAVLLQCFLIALCSELSFCTGTDTIEAPTMRDGRLLEVVDVEGASSATDYQDGRAVVSPYVLRSVYWAEVRPLLLLASFPAALSESLVSVGGMPSRGGEKR